MQRLFYVYQKFSSKRSCDTVNQSVVNSVKPLPIKTSKTHIFQQNVFLSALTINNLQITNSCQKEGES